MKLLRAILIVLILLASSCSKDNGTQPGDNGKDWRSIAWEIDTIAYPGSYQTAMRNIYSTSPENVYIVGWNDRAFGKMFHYDGISWTDVHLNVSQGGLLSVPVDGLWAIQGFGPNNIWAVGERLYDNPYPQEGYSDSSVVIHYNGAVWQEQSIAPSRGRRLQCVWGSSPTDIWAAGMNTVLHYNGVSWKQFQPHFVPDNIQLLSIAGLSASEIYMVGSRADTQPPTDTTFYLLYRFDGIAWSIMDSSVQTASSPVPRFGVHLKVINGSLFSVYPGVYKKTDGQWQLLFDGVSPIVDICGLNANSIFAVGRSGGVYHYNGSDWHWFSLLTAPQIAYFSAWQDESVIVAVGNDGFQTYVLIGK